MSSLLHLGETLVYDHFLKVKIYTWVCACVYVFIRENVHVRVCMHMCVASTLLFVEAGFLTGLGPLVFLDCCVVSKPQAASWSRSLDPSFCYHRTQ